MAKVEPLLVLEPQWEAFVARGLPETEALRRRGSAQVVRPRMRRSWLSWSG